METLCLALNQLGSLPNSFGNLHALKTLILNENQLRSLPDSFENLLALKILDLSFNQLGFLTDSFGNLLALQELNLSSNQLRCLPDSFGNLHNLRNLDLLSNQLKTLPSSVQNFDSLNKLDLRNNAPLLLEGRNASEWGQNELQQHFGDRVALDKPHPAKMPENTTKEDIYNSLDQAELRIERNKFANNHLLEIQCNTIMDGEEMLEKLLCIITSLNLSQKSLPGYVSYESLSDAFEDDEDHHNEINRDEINVEKIWKNLLPRLTNYIKTLYDLPLEANDVRAWKMYQDQIPETQKALSFILEGILNTEDSDTKAMLFTQLVHGLLHCPTGQAEGINSVAFALQESGYKVNDLVSMIEHILAVKKNTAFGEAILMKGADDDQNVHLISHYRDQLKDELGLSSVIKSYHERLGPMGVDPFGDNKWNVVKVFYDLVTPERLIEWLMEKTETSNDRLDMLSLLQIDSKPLSPEEKQIEISRLQSKTQQNRQFRPLTTGHIARYLYQQNLIKDDESDDWKQYFTEDPLKSDQALLTRDGAKALLIQMGFLIERVDQS